VDVTQQPPLTRLTYQLTLPGQPIWLLWFEAEQLEALPTLDAALVSLIQPLQAMAKPGWQLHVNGTVSPSLVWHLREFQTVWSAWMGWPVIPITADCWQEVVPEQPHQAIASFSGGVDSAFTAYQGSVDRLQPYPVKALLMVHGFDIALTDEAAWQQAVAHALPLSQSLGQPLVTLKTNLGELHRLALDWNLSYASAVAGCLRLFNPRFGAGLIPSSFPYGGLHFPAGSNPVSDPLLSSAGFAIKLHGSAFTRADKTWHLADWPEFLAHMRVCWQANSGGNNCGQCEKCLRMRLLLALYGLDNAPAFSPDPDIRQVLCRVRLSSVAVVDAYQRIHDLARQSGHPLAKPLGRAIRYNQRINQIKRWLNKVRGKSGH
jgi:hypothetical protein